jgi:hypothetical protein
MKDLKVRLTSRKLIKTAKNAARFVRTDVSEKRVAFIYRVEKIRLRRKASTVG